MAEIPSAAVKALRERTGAGFMDCKKALAATAGDMEAAVDWLRAKGLADAGERGGRPTAEGLVGISVLGTMGAIVEVNCETDFVARSEPFQEFVRNVAQIALATGDDVEELLRARYPGNGTVREALTSNIAKMGENQSLRRAARLEVARGVISSYVHLAVGPGLGTIGVLVALESDVDPKALGELGKHLAQHIAAAAPLALRAEDLDQEQVERERAVARQKAAASGKPANIVETMIEGVVAKYRKEKALLSQLSVRDNKTRVEDVIGAEARRLGADIALKGFVRFKRGEGLEREPCDLAAEVAASIEAGRKPRGGS